VKLLIDAQLPRRMVGWMRAAGCDTVHTLDLPDGNATSDGQVIITADREGRVVVTIDADFVNSHLLPGDRQSCCSSRPATSATETSNYC
jgi:predicted nuclease of predicted toxin-antitoxin system